jgi:toxin secretion/phage lysis holin
MHTILPIPPKLTAAIASVFAFVVGCLGGWTPAMQVLVIIIALDIFTGILLAFIQKRVSSKVSWVGIVKKVLIFAMIMLAAQVDVVLGQDGVIKNLVVLAYIASEGISVVENTVAAGLPVPDFLREALAQLRPEDGRKVAPPLEPVDELVMAHRIDAEE